MDKTIIDLHMHIVPGVDDGSGSIDESVTMLKSAYNQGARAVFCTSHQWGSGISGYDKQFELLENALKYHGVDISLYKGNEVLFCEFAPDVGLDVSLDINLKKLKSGEIYSLHNTKYVLTEFSSKECFDYTVKVCRALSDDGFIPVIAHAERIINLTLDNYIYLTQSGYLLQCNAYSFEDESKDSTKEMARTLLENEMISFIGSDAHRLDHRPPEYKNGVNYIISHSSDEYAWSILQGNAEKLIIQGEKIS